MNKQMETQKDIYIKRYHQQLFEEMEEQKVKTEETIVSFEQQIETIKSEAQNKEQQMSNLLKETNINHEREFGELNEKYEKLKNENLLLTDNVRQLKRDLNQQESDNNFFKIQSTNQFEAKIRDLLEKYNSLEETSQKNTEYYQNQYECKTNLHQFKYITSQTQQNKGMNELVSNHQSAIVKLRLSKETITKQQLQIEQLLNEISSSQLSQIDNIQQLKLNVRASTQFHNLTPRPSFQELEEICISLNDPAFKFEEQTEKQKNSTQIIKFSDADSASKLKKISQVLKQGFLEYRESLSRLSQTKSTSQTLQNKYKKSDKSTRSSKNLIEDSKQSRKQSQFQPKKSLPKVDEDKRKLSPKRSKMFQDLKQAQRNSIQLHDLNMSDNLSLNSEDKQALQKEFIDEYEDTLNDF